jgi:hypothetical protein
MSFTKENKWYRLKGKCFHCNKGDDTDTWNHSKDSCCSSCGYLYINHRCEIACDECKDKQPSFVMRWRFDCGRHAYESPNRRYLIGAISALAKMEDIPTDVFEGMNRILLDS